MSFVGDLENIQHLPALLPYTVALFEACGIIIRTPPNGKVHPSTYKSYLMQISIHAQENRIVL